MSQAIGRLMGQSEADLQAENQDSIVNDLREALDVYHAKNDAYPAKLGDLIGFVYDPMDDPKYAETVVNIPNDVYTGKPYVYALKDGSYELKYEMHFAKDSKSLTKDQYVEGVNTATPDVSSVEGGKSDTGPDQTLNLDDSSALSQSTDSDGDLLDNDEEAQLGTDPNKADTDGDGLDDWQEVRFEKTDPLKADTDGDGLSDGAEVDQYHTDPLKADTDGDGFSDGQEVSGGFDPLTNSKTGAKVEVQ